MEEAYHIWNATVAALRFGEVTMKPGDTMSFTKKIGFGDIISETELKSGEVVHGDGYLVNGEGLVSRPRYLERRWGFL
jgi:hypothetical protein